jgi:5-(carboxyamino)imidazole ribonucleotide synthase
VIVGILGGGQLARMLALAGYPIGIRCRCFDPSREAPAGQVSPLTAARFDDLRALRRFAREVEVLTYDWENVPVDAVRAVRRLTRACPNPDALARSQDRLLEKSLFRALRIPTPEFRAVESERDLTAALDRIGAPGILKTRRLGYDGKGQARIASRRMAHSAWRELGGAPLIYEQFLRFEREVSLIGVRSRRGAIAFYPLTENVHVAGMLSYSRAPYSHRPLQRAAERYVGRLLRELRYVGVLAVEFFVTRSGLIANEMAPRVHNSGHWTIEGAVTSQFENHLRAVTGLPLGSTETLGHAAMVNLIGTMPTAEAALAVSGLHLHDYGKAPRPGRKLGHATIVAATREARDRALRRLLRLPGVRRPPP